MHVLYWGHFKTAPIPYFRGGQFVPFWSQHGVEVQYVPYPTLVLDPAQFDWADVVVFRRWYVDDITERAWDMAGSLGKARLYDTDDLDIATPMKVPNRPLIVKNIDFVKRMAREADLVTTATPALAARYAPYARREPVVMRNAVDLPLYEPDQPREDDRTTSLFYGTHARLRDYFGAADERGRWKGGYAHSAVKTAGLRTVWIGDETVGPKPADFDAIVPYNKDMLAFFRALGNAHADIGVAPLLDDEFNHCKSELHWLELTAAGVAVVAQRMMGGGPYSVIRDGVDGLLVKGHQDWIDAVKRLARNPDLRTEMVAAARERMVAEYDPNRRAVEWAESFRLAREGG
jgi:hypothetical protein